MASLESFADEAVQRCPFPLIKRMHEEAPVYFDPITNFYVVSRYDDIAYVSNHPEYFSNKTSVITGGEYTNHPLILERYRSQGGWPRIHTLVSNDPPEHTHVRAIVDRVFTGAFVKQLEPYIVSLCDELIDQFIQAATTDLHTNYCIKIPMFIISDQLGIPRSQWQTIKLWSDVIINLISPSLSLEERLRLVDIHIESQKYLAGRREQYRAEPADNFLSRLANAELPGEAPLTMIQFLGVAEQFLVAGNETTTGAIGHAVAMLIRSSALMSQLRAEPAKIGNFVEEVLRMHAPSPHLYRSVLQDVELSGVMIPQGSTVMISYLAGNYDPLHSDRPDEVNLSRPGIRNHLAFGRGIHYCVGNLLARAELRIAISRLLSRLDDIRFDTSRPEPRIAPVFHTHQLDSLHIAYTSKDLA